MRLSLRFYRRPLQSRCPIRLSYGDCLIEGIQIPVRRRGIYSHVLRVMHNAQIPGSRHKSLEFIMLVILPFCFVHLAIQMGVQMTLGRRQGSWYEGVRIAAVGVAEGVVNQLYLLEGPYGFYLFLGQEARQIGMHWLYLPEGPRHIEGHCSWLPIALINIKLCRSAY